MNSNLFAFASGMYYAMCFSTRHFIIPAWRIVKWLVIAIAATAFVLGVATRNWAHNYVEAHLAPTVPVVEPTPDTNTTDVWGESVVPTVNTTVTTKPVLLLTGTEFAPLPTMEETPATTGNMATTLTELLDNAQLLRQSGVESDTTQLDYNGRYTELVSMTVKQLRAMHKVPSRYTRKADIVKYIMAENA